MSIGIPTYNRPMGLMNSLECLTKQSHFNIEIIISDNCSPIDEVEEIAKKYVESDSRVKYFRQPENMGAAFNFSFVLQQASGDYFMWAADDDWWEPEFIEKIIAAIQQSPKAIAGFCNYSVVNEENIRQKFNDPLPYLHELTHSNDFKRLSSFINQYEGYGKSNIFYSIIETNILKNIPFDLTIEKVPLGGDLSLIYSWLRSGQIVVVDQVLRRTTIGNVKQNAQFITEYDDKRWKTILFTIYTGKWTFYWKTWKDNLFFYFYLTSTSQLSAITKTLLYFTISKKIMFFCYDLVCYNIVTRGFDLFQYLKRKESLAQ